LDRLKKRVEELLLYCNQQRDTAIEFPVSEVNELFDSETFSDWKKFRDQDIKVQIAHLQRLDGVIKAINGLTKAS
jgi:hypothetical protein